MGIYLQLIVRYLQLEMSHLIRGLDEERVVITFGALPIFADSSN